MNYNYAPPVQAHANPPGAYGAHRPIPKQQPQVQAHAYVQGTFAQQPQRQNYAGPSAPAQHPQAHYARAPDGGVRVARPAVVQGTHPPQSPQQRGPQTASDAERLEARERINKVVRASDLLRSQAATEFERFDLDGDGFLSFEDAKQLVRAVAHQWGVPSPDSSTVRWLFDKMDLTGEQRLGRDGFHQFYRYVLCFLRDLIYPMDKRGLREIFYRRKQPKKMQEVYETGKLLGEGSYGKVHMVTERQTGNVRCCKAILKEKIRTFPEMIQNEVDTLQTLDHPNCVKYFESFEDAQFIYLIFEFIKGRSLIAEIVRRFVSLPACLGDSVWVSVVRLMGYFGEIYRYMRSILKAVAYCHGKGIVHKDLKPDNVMCPKDRTHEGDLKVIDFGFAEMFHGDKQSKAAAGTPYYTAPEVYAGLYNYKCDVWSAGVIVYMMVTQHMPFDAKTTDAYIWKITNQPVLIGGPLFEGRSPELIDLLKKMLHKKKEDRPTAAQCLAHPWFLAMERQDKGVLVGQRHNRGSIRALRPPPLAAVTKRGSVFVDYSKRSPFERFCLNLVAMNLSGTALQKAPEVFRALDVDNDGFLCREEMERGLSDLGLPRSSAEIAFNALDHEGTGLVSYSEFMAALVSADSEFAQHAFGAFRLLDSDGDGLIGEEEIKRLVAKADPAASLVPGGAERRYERQRVSAGDLFRRMDKNGNGKVDFDAFVEFLSSQRKKH
uniref:non-specific serine/threonine protein kinase n=1 Tax=Chromera velia CCMP2878 TaxID=1169474 RepID=A0A0G4G764_9ALVE|eukprot:Cvel_20540.t1-p1 / transcript=Cvel_20540.t1 / gene=Cvel_20540 / organism=Chromera_velia_CCMP2878 / gene_product=Calcium-dependent protein kinase 3, putative / transcript_product=Calcium-dependent protein kinase 3, putative / location=Cvel_scaffold1853:364-11085(+) / protein_length=716 / sequence_SO=supercontig / SO=protein_coding / is_pseudo=false